MVKVDRMNIDAKPPKEVDKGIFVTIFTDGSFCPKTKAWGVGIWIRYSDNPPIEMAEGGIGDMEDIYRVEYHGLAVALLYVMQEYDLTDKVVVFQCDNIGAVNKIYKDFKDELMEHGAKYVKAKHVKGHSGQRTARSRVNQIVDKLAGEQMRKFREVYNAEIPDSV